MLVPNMNYKMFMRSSEYLDWAQDKKTGDYWYNVLLGLPLQSPQIGGLKQHNFILPKCWIWRIQNPGFGREKLPLKRLWGRILLWIFEFLVAQGIPWFVAALLQSLSPWLRGSPHGLLYYVAVSSLLLLSDRGACH